MPSRPWYRWNPGDYLRDTYTLSWDADLLYRRILDALWEHGTLPTDLGDLSKICRIDPRKMRRIFPEVLPFLEEKSGRYTQKRMEAELSDVADKIEKKREAGRKGGLAKAKQVLGATSSNRGSKTLGSRARSDPDPDLSQTRVTPGSEQPQSQTERSPARTNGPGLGHPNFQPTSRQSYARAPPPRAELKPVTAPGLTPEDRAEAERIQREVIDPQRVARGLAPAANPDNHNPGKSNSGGEKEDSKS